MVPARRRAWQVHGLALVGVAVVLGLLLAIDLMTSKPSNAAPMGLVAAAIVGAVFAFYAIVSTIFVAVWGSRWQTTAAIHAGIIGGLAAIYGSLL